MRLDILTSKCVARGITVKKSGGKQPKKFTCRKGAKGRATGILAALGCLAAGPSIC